jgi:HEAT repeat protein
MEIILSAILSYLVSLAANLRDDAILTHHEEELRKQLKQENTLRKALASTRPLREELRAACNELARNRDKLGVSAQEKPLWRLLNDEIFQTDLVEWLMAGGIEEGTAVKGRLLMTMEDALTKAGASPNQIAFLKTRYFEALDKAVFAHPVLAHWRHQLSLDYLREQVAVLRRHANEAAGVYSPEKQKAALDRYCEKTLAIWDIIDLSNLPEGDIHMATQKLLLRQLYMPLCIETELTRRWEDNDATLARLEEERESRRRHEAGHFFTGESDRKKLRLPVGELLDLSRRLMILGDPGGGKTTMLRWMATAYLLRYKSDDAFSQIPDAHTLPSQHWIPALIRCRDLGEADLCRSFTEFLTQHLNKTDLLPEEADVMRAVILDRIAKGGVLLLVDGLDEIANSNIRMMFCQEIERTAARYPEATIVVTSRIVGYRDMPYRMGSGFEHGVIAELDRKDKDLFAWRWIEVTEQHLPDREKAHRAQELIDALHSSDRIENLTGNPMMLTTVTLVKRKVGKLPNRRNKLYSEAVSVLLNWNSRLYKAIEEEEAIPQLEYLAYEYCRLGVQRLPEDEVLDLLDKVRTEYPNLRAIRRRDPQAFLELLEARSSILSKSGGIWRKNKTQEKPVWEFRHLTFQEYLAARSLLDGRYPGRDKNKSLAEQMAPLAGSGKGVPRREWDLDSGVEAEIPESWREALRLLVADCKDDDVDEVLLAILNPLAGEEGLETGRPRAVLAALCLADEPNVSEETAQQVLSVFANKVGFEDNFISEEGSFARAAIEIEGSMWLPLLKKSLIEEFCLRPSDARVEIGLFLGNFEKNLRKRSGVGSQINTTELAQRIKSGDRVKVLYAALSLIGNVHRIDDDNVEILADSLIDLLSSSDLPIRHAGALALGSLSSTTSYIVGKPTWLAADKDITRVGHALITTDANDNGIRIWLAIVLGCSKDSRALSPLLRWLDDPRGRNSFVRDAAIAALGRLGDRQAVPPLLAKLDDLDAIARVTAIEVLGRLGDRQAVPPLLTKLDDPENFIRRTAIEALGRLGDRQAVPPLLTKLDDFDATTRVTAIEALGRLGDRQAVPPLLAKLDDPENYIRVTAIEALGRLGDRQAVPPLLAKLDDPKPQIRWIAIEALGRLGDRQAVPPLLAKLDDPENFIRWIAIEALGRLGDQQATESLILLVEDRDHRVSLAAAAALVALGADRGSIALTEFLTHGSALWRKAAVREIVRIRDIPIEKKLLSRDLDGKNPWIDPDKNITEARITTAARDLGITAREVRSLYESIAADFHLKLV